jgi:hypothetical protein
MSDDITMGCTEGSINGGPRDDMEVCMGVFGGPRRGSMGKGSDPCPPSIPGPPSGILSDEPGKVTNLAGSGGPDPSIAFFRV